MLRQELGRRGPQTVHTYKRNLTSPRLHRPHTVFVSESMTVTCAPDRELTRPIHR